MRKFSVGLLACMFLTFPPAQADDSSLTREHGFSWQQAPLHVPGTVFHKKASCV